MELADLCKKFQLLIQCILIKNIKEQGDYLKENLNLNMLILIDI